MIKQISTRLFFTGWATAAGLLLKVVNDAHHDTVHFVGPGWWFSLTVSCVVALGCAAIALLPWRWLHIR